jgi:hypothetical protein
MLAGASGSWLGDTDPDEKAMDPGLGGQVCLTDLWMVPRQVIGVPVPEVEVVDLDMGRPNQLHQPQ